MVLLERPLSKNETISNFTWQMVRSHYPKHPRRNHSKDLDTTINFLHFYCRQKLKRHQAMQPIRVYINGGGASPYDQIAKSHGWHLGVNSGGKNAHREKLFMVDNNWLNYDHNQHIKVVDYHRPHMATVRDIEVDTDQEKIYDQALEIFQYCDRVIVIPKAEILPKFLEIPGVILGLPLDRGENVYSWHYAKVSGCSIHLLGGSPHSWQRAIGILGDKIYSFDGNYLSNISRFGKVYINWKTRRPNPYEVPDGKDFNYRCFDFSLANLPQDFTPKYKQLDFFI